MKARHSLKNIIRINKADLFIFLVFIFILGANFRPGYVLLGNDNFTPEVSARLTLNRSVDTPAWRTYRAQGIASDSEQSDIGRTTLFVTSQKLQIPPWLISQGYFFFALFCALFFSGKMVREFFAVSVKARLDQQQDLAQNNAKDALHSDLIQISGSLFYISSLLAVWVYFFPVHLFVAAFSFLPFVVWSLFRFGSNPTPFTCLILCIATLFFTTTALTATMFITTSLLIVLLAVTKYLKDRKVKWGRGAGLLIFFLWQIFWALPFFTYVLSNSVDLKESLINRKITSVQLENEEKYNSFTNTIRYSFSWLDDRDEKTYNYPGRNFYKVSLLGQFIGYLPIFFAILGGIFFLRYRLLFGFLLIATSIIGIIFIKGVEWGALSTLTQVFRWRSSKFWPLFAGTIPFISTMGLLWLFESVRSRMGKIVSSIVVFAVFALLIYYIHPMFAGHLIRPNVYTQIPKEYYALADFLKQSDPVGRIYVAPEANTLYFRNYSWGFFGSVINNYLLPNPIIEKALIIGSRENETSYELIRNSYYSKDPELFARVLRFYNVSYLLFDEHASRGAIGYSYDQVRQQQMIVDNPNFHAVFKEGKLTLYQLASEQRDRKLIQANPANVAKKISYISNYLDEDHFYTDESEKKGVTYLQALELDSDSNTKLILSTPHRLSISRSDLFSSPSQIVKSGDSITVAPAYPKLLQNGQYPDIKNPMIAFLSDQSYQFITVNDQVVGDEDGGVAVNTSYDSLLQGALVFGWTADDKITTDLLDPDSPYALYCNGKKNTTSLRIDKKGVLCGLKNIPVSQDTIFEGEVIFETGEESVLASLCFDSLYKKGCINDATQIKVKGERSITFKTNKLVQSGDEIKVFLNIKALAKPAVFSIKKFVVNFYINSVPLEPVEQADAAPMQEVIVEPQKSLSISIDTPFVAGPTSLQFDPWATFQPEWSFYFFDGEHDDGVVDIKDGIGYEITHKEGNAALYAKIPYLESTGLGQIHASARNVSGIPADIYLKDVKVLTPLWEDKLYAKQTSVYDSLFFVPKDNPVGQLELFSTALGPRASSNLIHNLSFQTIPKEWLNMKLTPETLATRSRVESRFATLNDSNSYLASVDKGEIITLDTARSPYWIIRRVSDEKIAPNIRFSSLWSLYRGFFLGKKTSTRPVVVNGWEQGFIVPEKGTYLVIFWPNLLVYFGYGVIGVILTAILFWIVRDFKKRG